ncbi:hypothetical protein J1N35_037549 [Gossypium stocksii]|uniref:Uncharacterized protein n=1 Tax=Gossypium stocksii TaxID=47602 RepID=A0A9D3UK25_9ROSI|nr:hypothetical protein J1N35_037549 [Gossypium stocksii]
MEVHMISGHSALPAPPPPHEDVLPLSHGDIPPGLRENAHLDQIEHLMSEMIGALQHIASANAALVHQGLPLERL